MAAKAKSTKTSIYSTTNACPLPATLFSLHIGGSFENEELRSLMFSLQSPDSHNSFSPSISTLSLVLLFLSFCIFSSFAATIFLLSPVLDNYHKQWLQSSQDSPELTLIFVLSSFTSISCLTYVFLLFRDLSLMGSRGVLAFSFEELISLCYSFTFIKKFGLTFYCVLLPRQIQHDWQYHTTGELDIKYRNCVEIW